MAKPFSQIIGLISAAAFLAESETVNASHCLIGWPAVVGPTTKDGNTDVTTFAETPSPDYYMLGGNSDSVDFTEQEECATKEHGCAYIATWNKVSQKFTQKWIFTDVDTLVHLEFEPFDSSTDRPHFAAVFNRIEDEEIHNVITFNKWTGTEAEVGQLEYTIREPYDDNLSIEFNNIGLFQEDRFHWIVNNPSQLQSTDYFFVLDDGELQSVHSDELNTADKSNVHLGLPSRKYYQGFGYDENHIIQLATVTIPRSERELGGSAFLNDATTYNVIFSRSLTDVGDPFTYTDVLYATKETSGRDFYFYSHFKMSYEETSSGNKASDVYLHTVGSHSQDENIIMASTWEVSASHELVHNVTYHFEMPEDVQIISVGTVPEDDLFDIYITYMEVGQGKDQVGKVLYVNMLDKSTAKTWDLMEEYGKRSTERSILSLHQHDDYFLYVGRTNYHEDVSTLVDVDVDWSDTEYQYGFFEVYTSSEHCSLPQERESLNYGELKAVDFSGSSEEVEPRIIVDEETIKQPPNQLNLGDLDDEDYDKLLFDQTQIDDDGFPITFRDWLRRGLDEDDEEYPEFIFEIEGINWMNKFELRDDSGYESVKRAANLSVNVLGATGLVNSIFSLWVWTKFLSDYTNNTGFWYAWFGACFVNGLFYMPIAVVWPAMPFAAVGLVRFFLVMTRLSLAGPFIAYWANLAAMYYAFYYAPTESESTFASSSEATKYVAGYAVLSVVNSVIALTFIQQLEAYFNELLIIEILSDAEEDAQEAADANSGGIIIF